MKGNARMFAKAARFGRVRVLSSFIFQLSSFCSGRLARFSFALLLSLLLAFPSFAAEPLTPVATPAPKLTRLDSLRALAARADTAGTTGAKARTDTVQVVMHHHNHRQQIITGGVVMACLAGIMVMMNNYNPRPSTQF